MQEATCRQCGTSFVCQGARGRPRVFCSDECSKAWHRAAHNERRGCETKPENPTRACIVCNADLTGRRSDVLYCGKACQKWANRHGLTAARVDGPIAGTCELCGEPFRTRDRRKRFCTERCRQKAENARRQTGGGIIRKATCAQCGEGFEHNRGAKNPPRYCSRQCVADALATLGCDTCGKRMTWEERRDHRHRCADCREQRRRLRLAVQPTTAYMQALRSDPCAYCGAPAETLDHVDPTSKGGLDAWQNMTAACNDCNATKRALPLLPSLLYLDASREWRALDRARREITAAWAA